MCVCMCVCVYVCVCVCACEIEASGWHHTKKNVVNHTGMYTNLLLLPSLDLDFCKVISGSEDPGADATSEEEGKYEDTTANAMSVGGGARGAAGAAVPADSDEGMGMD